MNYFKTLCRIPWNLAVVSLIACTLMAGCGRDRLVMRQGSHLHASGSRPELKLHPLASSKLQNLIQISDGIYSGGEPRGDAAFQELVQLGVRTVLSVDGASPDLVRAKKAGLRYVHIPIGYDGIESEAALSIVRAMHETNGKTYIHCHHGRHRGPVAAAIACMADGQLGPDEGLRILEVAGTSRDYVGLWRDVEAFRPPGADAVFPELVEKAAVEDLVHAMAQMDRIFDRLILLQNHRWVAPSAHADLDPKQEATLLRELLHESGRLNAGVGEESLREGFTRAEDDVLALQEALAQSDFHRATAVLDEIRISCRDCHRVYRDRGGR